MKKKTRERIKRKKDNKVRHCLDTSVLIEALSQAERGEACLRYLTGAGKAQTLVIPDLVLAEFVVVTHDKPGLKEISERLMVGLSKMLKGMEYEISMFDDKALQLLPIICQNDYNVKYRDEKILACAMSAGCHQLITIDGPMLDLKDFMIRQNGVPFRVDVITPEEAIEH